MLVSPAITCTLVFAEASFEKMLQPLLSHAENEIFLHMASMIFIEDIFSPHPDVCGLPPPRGVLRPGVPAGQVDQDSARRYRRLCPR